MKVTGSYLEEQVGQLSKAFCLPLKLYWWILNDGSTRYEVEHLDSNENVMQFSAKAEELDYAIQFTLGILKLMNAKRGEDESVCA